jgi:polyisoprenoid-binding protein YceI
MTKHLRLLIPLVCAALLSAADSLPGHETVLQIDPALTKVGFTLSDVLHTVHGTFALKRGTIRFDPLTGKAGGELVVDAGSGNSGSPARDRRMTANILESGRYPEITFRPDRVVGHVAAEGISRIEMHGMFAIHGAEHEVTLPLQVEASGGKYTASGRFAVPYVKWGMKNPSTLILRVADKVEIDVQTVAR